MNLTVELPPIDRRLDVNNGNWNKLARACAVKKARSLASLLTLEAMMNAGVKRGHMKPRFVLVTTNWYRHRVDYDNRLANVKAYQDGVFDAVGANDKEVVAGCSLLRHLPKGRACDHLSVCMQLFEERAEFLAALNEGLGIGG